MSKAQEILKNLVDQFGVDDEKFDGGNKSAGIRARKALQDIKRACDARKKEMLGKGDK